MNYEAYVAMSFMVWRIIATIKEPVLSRIETRLTNGFAIYGDELYNAIVWTIAFCIGMGYATMAGENGDMLRALGWTDGYLEIGQAMTAVLIACGSAGMNFAEKMLNVKKPTPDA